jgi:hypothetical protein
MTNPVLNAAKIVGRGILLGVGFSIAFGIFAFTAEHWSTHRAAEQTENAEDLLAARNPVKDISRSRVGARTRRRRSMIATSWKCWVDTNERGEAFGNSACGRMTKVQFGRDYRLSLGRNLQLVS